MIDEEPGMRGSGSQSNRKASFVSDRSFVRPSKGRCGDGLNFKRLLWPSSLIDGSDFTTRDECGRRSMETVVDLQMGWS